MLDQLVGLADDHARAAEAPAGGGLDLGPVATGRDPHHAVLGRDAHVAADRLAHVVESVELVDREVAPVRVPPHQLEGLRPRAADEDRDVTERRGLLLGVDELEVLTRRTRTARRTTDPGPPPGSRPGGHPHPGGGVADAEHLELGGDRAPADAQLEAAPRGVVEGDGLAGEHRRVAEGVAQDQVADHEPLGVGDQPHGGGHGLVHGLRLGHGRGQVVHQGHAVEPGGLRGAGPLDERVE